VAWLAPQVIVISSGAGNQYGHPHAETLATYRAVAGFVLRTDEDGTILVRVPAAADEYLVLTDFTP
jgi:competence protein ComEC